MYRVVRIITYCICSQKSLNDKSPSHARFSYESSAKRHQLNQIKRFRCNVWWAVFQTEQFTFNYLLDEIATKSLLALTTVIGINGGAKQAFDYQMSRNFQDELLSRIEVTGSAGLRIHTLREKVFIYRVWIFAHIWYKMPFIFIVNIWCDPIRLIWISLGKCKGVVVHRALVKSHSIRLLQTGH